MPSSSVVLHLTLDGGSQLTGVVVSDDGVGPLPFSGWLGLVEAVEVCRHSAPAKRAGPERSGQGEEEPRC